jgi:hypothetical protein
LETPHRRREFEATGVEVTMKIRSTFVVLALFVPALATTGCKDSTAPKGPALNDDTTAMWFAWHLVDAIGFAAPGGSSSQTWSNQVVTAAVSGTATVNGSFTYSYGGAGPASRTYNNVTIQFNKYCYDPGSGTCVTGTVTVNGTCTTSYGYSSTTYSGYWQVTGSNVTVSSSQVDGQASITMQMYNDVSRIFAAYVTAGGRTYQVSPP